MSIYHFEENKSYCKLFTDQLNINKKQSQQLTEFETYSLIIILDVISKNEISDDLKNIVPETSKLSVSDYLESLIIKYLYNLENNYISLTSMIGICRILYLDKTKNQKELLIRLIVQVFKNGKIPDELLSKYHETFFNFLYIFSIKNSNNFNLLTGSILQIVTSTIFKDSLLTFNNSSFSLAFDIIATSFIDMNQLFIQIVNYKISQESNTESIKAMRREYQKKILFQMLKRLVFSFDCFTFLNKNHKLEKEDKELKLSKEYYEILDMAKKLFTDLQRKSIERNIKLFYEHSKYDDTLIGEFFKEDISFSIKVFTILHYFQENYGLEYLSDNLSKFYTERLASQGFIVEIGNVKVNLVENAISCKGYLYSKKEEYVKFIIEDYLFLLKTKDEITNSANGIIYEDEEEDASDEDSQYHEVNESKQSQENTNEIIEKSRSRSKTSKASKPKLIKNNNISSTSNMRSTRSNPKTKSKSIEKVSEDEEEDEEEEIIQKGMAKINLNKMKINKKKKKK